MSATGVQIELISENGVRHAAFHVQPDATTSLLENFENARLRSPFGCRVGTCGTCVLRVKEGAGLLESPHRLESDTLARVGEADVGGLRLACRAVLRAGAAGKLVVEKITIL